MIDPNCIDDANNTSFAYIANDDHIRGTRSLVSYDMCDEWSERVAPGQN